MAERNRPLQPGSDQPTDLAKAAGGEFAVVSARGLLESRLAPLSFVCPPFYPRAQLILLGGSGGAGKSTLTLQQAVCAAAGKTLGGENVDPVKAVFVTLEDPPSLVLNRAMRTVKEFGLDLSLVEENFTVLDGSDWDSALAIEINLAGITQIGMTSAFESLREHCAGCALIIIDNASDAFLGNENARQLVRTFLRALARLAKELDAAIVLLAHIDKAAARHGGQGHSYSGSTAWHNTPRVRYAMIPAAGGVELRMEKNNLGPMLDPMKLSWTPSGVLVPHNANSIQAEDGASGLDNAAVMEAFQTLNEVGASIPTARTGPSTALNVVMTTPECPAWLKSSGRASPEGKDRFWSAVTRLERIGWIQRALVKTADRKERERYLLGPNCPDQYRQARRWAGGNP